MTQRRRNPRGGGGQLRDDIVTAAIVQIDRRGSSEGLSLRAIATEVGIAAPSIYRHFADLDQLFAAVVDRLSVELIEITIDAEETAAAQGADPFGRMLASLVATNRFGLERPGHYKALFERHAIASSDRLNAEAFGRSLQKRIADLIKEIGRANGILHGDPERLALLIWAGSHGITSLLINKHTPPWPDAAVLFDDLIQALLRL